MSDESYTFGPWESEGYTFAFSTAGEATVLAFEPSVAVEIVADVKVSHAAPPVEHYSFFWPGVEINEFQSGPPGAKGDPGQDGVGIPEVFIDGAPATLNFSPVQIEGQTVYEMQVTAT